MTEITEAVERATRPIVGMHNRTAQEVFDIMCDRVRFALQAAREEASQGAGEPVASQSAGAALASAMWGVTLIPASSPNPQARIKALEEALETARDALQAAYQRTGHADDLAAAHIADAAHLRTLETSNV